MCLALSTNLMIYTTKTSDDLTQLRTCCRMSSGKLSVSTLMGSYTCNHINNWSQMRCACIKRFNKAMPLFWHRSCLVYIFFWIVGILNWVHLLVLDIWFTPHKQYWYYSLASGPNSMIYHDSLEVGVWEDFRLTDSWHKWIGHMSFFGPPAACHA